MFMTDVKLLLDRVLFVGFCFVHVSNIRLMSCSESYFKRKLALPINTINKQIGK